ncbi:MAG: hypothetical protein CMF61_00525 [Magnetococcales bacterium]|nr:hypothetical protein [Magnetococcales bacterium]
MFHERASESSSQAFYSLFPTRSNVENIIEFIKCNGIHNIYDLEGYTGEEYFEAAQYFQSSNKAILLQLALVKGYFFAAFEIAENTFKEKDCFEQFYTLNDALARYDTFIYLAEKFLKTAPKGDVLTQKAEAEVMEAHFKMGLIFYKQQNKVMQSHHMNEATKMGHEMACQLMQSPDFLAAA